MVRFVIATIGTLLLVDLMGWIDLGIAGTFRTGLEAYLHINEASEGLDDVIKLIRGSVSPILELSSIFWWILLVSNGVSVAY